jgi:ribulose-5-phosphate 4-epimerase/fuculose-1-phosphate aldolase
VFNRLVKFTTDIALLVSSQRRVDDKTREVLLPRALRKTLTEAGRLAAERQLTVGQLSEISMRLPGDKLAINKDGAWFPHLSEDDFVVAALAHERTLIKASLPSQHVNWHRWAYTFTPAQAALLCQPVSAVLAAEQGCLPAARIFADVPQLASDVIIVTPTEEDIQKSLMSHPVLLIQGYGLFIWGQDLFQVVALAETIDLLCKISITEHQK